MEDLHKLYPEALPNIPTSDMKEFTVDKKVKYFFEELKSIREKWRLSPGWMAKYGYDKIDKLESTNVEQIVDIMFATLDYVIKAATELFDLLEDEVLKEDYVQPTVKSTETEFCSRQSEKAISPVPRNDSFSGVASPNLSKTPPAPVSSGVQVCQNSDPLEEKNETMKNLKPQSKEEMGTETGIIEYDPRTSKNTQIFRTDEKDPSPTNVPAKLVQPKPPLPPPPPLMSAKGSKPTAMPLKKGPAAHPPPPPGAGKSLFQRKGTSKLKRSTQMPSLFRKLKDKMEGSNLPVKSANKRKTQLGGSSGGKEGFAASLAELTKRSTYFQQIEEDIQKYAKPILELKVAINSFQTNDMVKLLKFRNNVESILAVLIDESQVLVKFEGFPTKKLETLRTAATLYSKLDTMVTTLKNWEIVPPLVKLIDKFECYFRKVREEMDAIERNKDEESKNFKNHDIIFDFLMITRVKESMVDLSSDFMESALKERREAEAKGIGETRRIDQKMKESVKMLWRVFQFAFQAYSFAGGLDDRFDKLAKELAEEILVHSQNQ
ncbi:hypothetical protein JCGZ_01107 [Jatropha curcas]|uniref:Hydroxyproline-rich glycoprotein family protein n=1 Tax=Jatropha curcas TaxID=180498 RepID=A0A067L4C4_JATCU|nr:uncharacterized protein At4g04980 isoform X1 [Jatropha curcas]KDP39350.1 hypothetical protein JCGZ_01107 [Jatropha curcas]